MANDDALLDELLEDQPNYEDIAGMLQRYVELDALVRPMREEMDELKAVLRAWIEEHNEPVVTDSGWVASLKDVSAPRTVDVISFAKKHPEYLAELGAAGVLTANLKQLDGLKGRSAAADEMSNKYVMHGGYTNQLRVERP